jgi:hypothetical protein
MFGFRLASRARRRPPHQRAEYTRKDTRSRSRPHPSPSPDRVRGGQASPKAWPQHFVKMLKTAFPRSYQVPSCPPLAVSRRQQFPDSIPETSANYTGMSLRERTRPGLGIIEPCLPSPAKVPPSGPGWLHEIKHDGFRILARRDSAGVRLITRRKRFLVSLSLYGDGSRQAPGSLVLDRRRGNRATRAGLRCLI